MDEEKKSEASCEEPDPAACHAGSRHANSRANSFDTFRRHLPKLPPGVPRYDVPEDPAGAARVLYTRLREADQLGHDVLVACLPRAEGLGIAVPDGIPPGRVVTGVHASACPVPLAPHEVSAVMLC